MMEGIFADLQKMEASSLSLSVNLILLGKTGAGKSASGNTILGREAFKIDKSSKSVTRQVTCETGSVYGFPVTVHDTPGLLSEDMSEAEIQKMINEKVLQRCETDPSVFLLVIKADRFTAEEREAVEKIEKLLGEKRLKYTWILFTRGDELEEENMTIEEFINQSEPLKNLVQKYDQRYHVFNNKTKGPSEQARLLILKILRRYFGVTVTNWTRDDFLQYSRQLTLDLNTVNKLLRLSNGDRVITNTGRVHSYPDHPDRFQNWCQVLCEESVCGRCYWEIEWSGLRGVRISVSYKSISRKGLGYECVFGCNDQSWSLCCSPSRYSFRHNNIETILSVKPISSRIGVYEDDDDDDDDDSRIGVYEDDDDDDEDIRRIGVYVDHSAGTLSFYSVSDTMSLIHTVQTTFTQPLYPGFSVGFRSSAKLCETDESFYP